MSQLTWNGSFKVKYVFGIKGLDLVTPHSQQRIASDDTNFQPVGEAMSLQADAGVEQALLKQQQERHSTHSSLPYSKGYVGCVLQCESKTCECTDSLN